jgi:hypothetical protein
MQKDNSCELASYLRYTKNQVETYHLQAIGIKNLLAHEVLGDLYSDLNTLIDKFIECYQGKYGVIKNYKILDSSEDSNYVKHLTECVQYLEDYRYDDLDKTDTFLQNILDEIIAAIYRAIFKLK